jgi:hypothetical protein
MVRWGSGTIIIAAIGGTAIVIAVTDGKFVNGKRR